MGLKWNRFASIDDIQKAVVMKLNRIPKEEFLEIMKKLEDRANLCINKKFA